VKINIERRLGRLENRRYAEHAPAILRVVVSPTGGPLNLSASKCMRTRNANNTITEFVELDGSRGELTDEELQRFVAGFPIQDAAQKKNGGGWY
jgi:hypothetical protein